MEGQILSNLFLVGNKDGGQRSEINLKELNAFFPYTHFKMEGIHVLKDILIPGDFMCKMDLKSAYFTVLLHQDSQKLVWFIWEGKINQFLCLCFGLGPAPLTFTKIMKILISLLRRLNIRIAIFLDDVLLLGQTPEEVLSALNSLIFLLQNLGFVINQKKSQLQSVQETEFLGLFVNPNTMTLALPPDKLAAINSLCQKYLTTHQVTILELT